MIRNILKFIGFSVIFSSLAFLFLICYVHLDEEAYLSGYEDGVSAGYNKGVNDAYTYAKSECDSRSRGTLFSDTKD